MPIRTQRGLIVFALAWTIGCSRSAEEYTKRADDYVAQKKYAEAVIEYRNAIQKNPQLGPVRLRLGDTYSLLGDLSHAAGEYIRAADLMPNDNDAQLKAGAMLLMAGRLAEAKTKAQVVLKRVPRHPGALMLLGNALAGASDLSGAIELVEQAVMIDPTVGSGYANLASLQLARGDRELAEASFKKAVNASPKSVTTRIALANFYRSQGRTVETERVLKEALAIDASDVTVNGNLADLFMRTGRIQEAEAPIRAIAAKMPNGTSQLMLAEYYIKANRSKEAAAILDKLAADKETYAMAKARLAVLDYTEGRAAEAHKTLDEVLKREPKNAIALVLKAKLLATERQFDQALKFAKAAEAANPAAAAEPQLIEAQIYMDRGQVEEAQAGFRNVLTSQPQSVAAQLALARLQSVLGNRDAAVQFAKQAAALAPGNAETRLTLATVLIDARDYGGAARELRDLQDAYPRSEFVQVQIGRLAMAQGDVLTARKAFSNAQQVNPNSADALAGLVSLDLQARNPAAAVARVAARTAAAPNDGQAWFLAAQAYAAAGDSTRAEQALVKAVELDPGNPTVFAQLGALYVRGGRVDAALAQFRRMSQQRPQSVGAFTMMGILLGELNRPAEARKAFERALEIDSAAPVAANNLAWLRSEADDNLDMALQLAQTASARLPGDPTILDTLGWVEYKKDLISDSIQHLSRAAQAVPMNPQPQFHLGMAYAKNGDDAEAAAALKRALALKLEGADASEARKMLAELAILGAP
jgi:tetratricopeptide (TPR) repeat protein